MKKIFNLIYNTKTGIENNILSYNGDTDWFVCP